MTALRRLRCSVLLPGFTGPTPPDWVRRCRPTRPRRCLPLRRTTSATRAGPRAHEGPARGSPRGCWSPPTRRAARSSRLDAGRARRGPVPRRSACSTTSTPPVPWRAGSGRQARAAGVDLVLAPVLDVNSEPDNPVIGVRSFGADPGLVARHGVAFVRGLQDAGVLGCAKHFPGHGATRVDSHVGLPVARRRRGHLARPRPAAVRRGRHGRGPVHHDRARRPPRAGRRPGHDAVPPCWACSATSWDSTGSSSATPSTCARSPTASAGGQARSGRSPPASTCCASATRPSPRATTRPPPSDGIATAVVEAVECGDLPLVRLEEASRRVAAPGAPARRGRRPVPRVDAAPGGGRRARGADRPG